QPRIRFTSVLSSGTARAPLLRLFGRLTPVFHHGRTPASTAGAASGGRSVVAAAHLVDRVQQHRGQHLHAVPDAAARPREVDHQHPVPVPLGDAGQPAGEHRGGHALVPAEGAQRLGDAGDLAGQQRPGGLGGGVGGGQPGPPGGEGGVVAGVQRAAVRLGDRFAVRHHPGAVGAQPGGAHRLHQDRAGAVRVHPGGGAVGGGDDDGARRTGARFPGRHAPSPRPAPERVQWPVLPPVFSSTRTSVTTASGSIALTMSTRPRAAVITQVSASISTPVRSAVRTVAVIATSSSRTVSSTSAPCTAIGWQSGTRSGVRLAPWMPAIRATASASPLGTVPPRRASITSAETSTRPVAVAVRAVTSLAVTSTMRARPAESRWLNPEGCGVDMAALRFPAAGRWGSTVAAVTA